jgi:hypothetical protein
VPHIPNDFIRSKFPVVAIINCDLYLKIAARRRWHPDDLVCYDAPWDMQPPNIDSIADSKAADAQFHALPFDFRLQPQCTNNGLCN